MSTERDADPVIDPLGAMAQGTPPAPAGRLGAGDVVMIFTVPPSDTALAVTIDAVNPSGQRLLGRDAGASGAALTDVAPADVAVVLLDHLREAVARGEAVRVPIDVTLAGGRCNGLAHFEPIVDSAGERGTRVVVYVTTETEPATRSVDGNVSAAAVGVMRGEPDIGVVFLSDAALDILGLDTDRALGQGWLEALQPNDRELAAAALARAATTSGSAEVDCRVITRDAPALVRIVAVPVRSDRGTMGFLASLEDVTRRREIEREAVHFRHLAESSPLGVTLTANDGTVTYANPRMLEIIGRRADEYIGGPSGVCLHPEDADRIEAAAGEAIARRGELAERARFVRPGGEVRWADIRSAFVYDSSERVVATVASVIDMTDDVARQQETDRLVQTLETTTDIVSFHDRRGRTFFVNRAGREFFGVLPDADTSPLVPADLLVSESAPISEIGRALEQDGVWQGEVELRAPDGRVVEVSTVVVAQRGLNGKVEYYSAVSRDISELRAIETRIANNEAWYRSLVQHAPDLILVLRDGGVIHYVSPSARKILGYEPEELVGSQLQEFAPPDELERLRGALEGMRDTPGEAHPFEVRVPGRDGRYRVIQGTVVNLLHDPAVAGTVINARDVTDRYEADAARRRSETALRAIVQSSPLAIFALDREGRVHLWNRACERVFGWAADEVVGLPVPFADPDGFFADVRAQVFAGETVIGAETRQQCKGGRPIALSVSVAPLRDATGRVVTAVAVAADVSEQESAEAALRESEERLRVLVAGVSDAISIIDADGTVRYSSPATTRIFGYEAEEIYGANVLDVVHPDDREWVYRSWRDRDDHPSVSSPMQLRVRKADGTYVDVEVIANNLLGDPSIRGVVMTTRDISERKAADARYEQTQAQLRESEARYRAVVDDQTELVCRYRPDTTLTFVNRAFADFYGRSQEECIGLRLLDLYPAVDRHREIERLASFGPELQVQTLEDWELDARHQLYWYQWTDRAFLDDNGNIVEFQSVGRDATERHRAAMLTSQQVETLEQVARGAPLEASLTGIARVFEQHFPAHVGMIWLYDPQGQQLRLGTTPILSTEFTHAYDRSPIDGATRDPAAAGPAARAVAGREVVVIEDVPDAPPSLWRDVVLQHDMRSCWSTPVFASDGRRVLGVLDVYARHPAVPSDEQRQIASLVTHLAAIAIERKEFEDRLAHQSLHDPLTSLPNRTLFLDRLAQGVARCRRTHSQVAVLFFDLDRFKVVNDSMGHEAGDELLVAVARRLESVLRPGDTVARFGGDEFTVLCEDLPANGGRVRALEIAERLSSAITAPIMLQANETFLSASIGIAIASTGEERPEELLRDADAAMYHAKEMGRGRVEVFDDTLRARALARHATETALHQALQRGEFCLFFQPIISLEEGRCVGAEALVRWQHPKRGLVPPTEFISLAEDTGLIVELGAWVLEEAARQSARWQLERDEPFLVSVNLSARQLAQPDLVERVSDALARTGASASNICLEITESVLMDDADATISAIERVRSLGVRLSIDDFGTGYSSLGYLKRFPVQVVKIDRSFVDGLGTDAGDTAIVSAVVGLAHALGMRAVAEGVETPEQLQELVDLGCDEAQGYFFAPPQPADDLRELMGRTRRWRPPGAPLMTSVRRAAGGESTPLRS